MGVMRASGVKLWDYDGGVVPRLGSICKYVGDIGINYVSTWWNRSNATARRIVIAFSVDDEYVPVNVGAHLCESPTSQQCITIP
jgi:hypothetical protein